jgi:hypothetical protein
MATYLVVNDADPCLALRVEGDSIKAAIESLNLADGASVKVYRIISEPKTVKVETETVRKVTVT